MGGNMFKLSVQIFLLVSSVFAFAYMIKNANFDTAEIRVEKKSVFLGVLKLIVGAVFSEKTLVSARENIEGSDLEDGVATCLDDCQEYASSVCKEECAGGEDRCFPGTREYTPGETCKLGTCFDEDSGTCAEKSTKAECESDGGRWLDDPNGNVAECKKACCVIGAQVKPLVTERECDKIGERSGIDTVFRSGITNELSCLALAEQDVEGACVFESASVKTCVFETKRECLGDGGASFPGVLCTHEDVGVDYEKQATTGCYEDKVYWFDSEGNRENIFEGMSESAKKDSWNNGRVKPASESCEISEGNNPLKNQATCGNCNRFTGSACGTPGENDKKIAGSDFVCKDIRCIDSRGKARENGESWCEYQGQVGIDSGSGYSGGIAGILYQTGPKEGFLRAVDTPGSSHFRATCIDGEIQKDRCGNGYRNHICVEERFERDNGKEVSTASCVTNLWQLCLNYNSQVEGEGEAREDSIKKRNEECLDNPHCILKKVDIAENFKFDLCTPKFSPGFDLQENPEGGALS